MSDHDTVWLVPTNCTIEGLEESKRFAEWFSGRAQQAKAKKPPFGVLLPKPIDDLTLKVVKYIEANGWQKTASMGEVRAGDTVIALRKHKLDVIPDNEKDADNPIRPLQLKAAPFRDADWLLWPLNLVEKEFFPPIDPVAEEIERRKREVRQSLESLRKELPDEPWVPLPRTLNSPFMEASQEVGGVVRDVTFSMEKGHHTRGSSLQLVELLIDIDTFLKKRGQGEPVTAPDRMGQFIHPATFNEMGVHRGMGFSDSGGKRICLIPGLRDLSPGALALYLVIIGEIESDVPLEHSQGRLWRPFRLEFPIV